MWDLETYRNHLEEEFGWDVWENKIQEQVKTACKHSLESVQDMFESKKGCFELYGYDYMVDDDFNVWMIEINSSPAMDYSTPVTERLVKMVLEDSVKVIVDHGMCPSAKKRKKIDTGLFECIYKANQVVDKPLASFGLNMDVKGI